MNNESIQSLMLDQLRESPFNTRLTFDEVDLQELADSIQQQGVMQPIVVRRVPGEEFRFEIVFGHRRYRATRLAGRDLIPCIVREMTDEEAAVAQIHENLKRRDVHAIEEGLGYVRLMHDHKVTIGELIAKTGKSKSHIYARLKLATLGEDAKAACLRGELDAETGTLLARYCRGDKLQAKGLQLITIDDADNPGKRKPISFREAKRVLRDHFCIRITAAPFDSEDAKLRPYTPACTSCPKMAGNDPELADSSDADVCTDPTCYQGKCEAHVHKAVAAAQKAGQQIVLGDDAKALMPHQWLHKPYNHVDISDVAFVGKAIKDGKEVETTFAEALRAMGKKAPKPILVVNPHKPGRFVEVLPDAEALKVLKHGMAGATVADCWDDYFEDDSLASAAGDSPLKGQKPGFVEHDSWAELPLESQAVLRGDLWDKVLRCILQRVPATKRTNDDLRLVLFDYLDMSDSFGSPVEDQLGWTDDKLDAIDDADAWRREQLTKMGGDQLAAILVMTMICNLGGNVHNKGEQRLAVAKRFGVDVIEVSGINAPAAQGDLVDTAG